MTSMEEEYDREGYIEDLNKRLKMREKQIDVIFSKIQNGDTSEKLKADLERVKKEANMELEYFGKRVMKL